MDLNAYYSYPSHCDLLNSQSRGFLVSTVQSLFQSLTKQRVTQVCGQSEQVDLVGQFNCVRVHVKPTIHHTLLSVTNS